MGVNRIVSLVLRWLVVCLASACLLAQAQSGTEAARAGSGNPITFPKDIPLKRDADTASTESSTAIQVFFLLIIAVAAAAMYGFSKRRRAPAAAATSASNLLKSLGWGLTAGAPRGHASEPMIIHRKRLDRQQTLYVIEWNSTQYLVAGGDSRISVIASNPVTPPVGQMPEHREAAP